MVVIMSQSIRRLGFAGELTDVDDVPFVRHPSSRVRLRTEIVGDSLTQQSGKDSADINLIVERFLRTGTLPPAKAPPAYGDVSELGGDMGERVQFAADVISRSSAFLNQRAAAELRARAEAQAKELAEAKRVIADFQAAKPVS